jgi:drug/metabolite transporter (DMT)-like permease
VALIFGANYLVLNEALRHLSPLVFAPLRFLLGATAMWTLLRLGQGRRAGALPTASTLGWSTLLVLGFLGIGLSSLAFTVALSLTSAAHGAVLNATSPLFGVILAAVVNGERPPGTTLTGLVVSFVGVALVVLTGSDATGGAGTAELWGDLAMLGSGVCWALYAVRLRPVVARYSPLLVSAYATTLGALLLVPVGLPAALATPWTHVPATTYLALVYTAVVVTAGANVLWVYGIKVIGVGGTMVYQYLPTIIGVALAAWLLHEPLVPLELVGAVLVLAGVGLSTHEGLRAAQAARRY